VKLYKKLDLSGSSCAGPIGELSGVYEEMRTGEAVEVILGDESTRKDLLAWAMRKGAQVVEESREGNRIRVVLVKG